jgi:phosphoglycerate kinase
MMLSGPEGGGGGVGPMSRFNKMTIYDLKGYLRGQRVLVRVDFNVSDKKTGEIKSDTRIKAALPTLEYLIAEGAQIVLISHNERPKDLLKEGIPEAEVRSRLSLRQAAEKLGDLFDCPVRFVDDTIGLKVREAVSHLVDGEVILLENTRFYPQDEKGDMDFARQIVADTGAKFFVLDGFSVAHRNQSSVTGVANAVKENGGVAVAGHLLQQEIDFLGKALIENPKRPYVAFMGGAKVADKIKVIENLLGVVDILVIGGAMIYPFLRAKGDWVGEDPLGRSEEEIASDIGSARRILTGPNYHKILLPWKMTMADNRIKDIDAEELLKILDLKITRQVGTPGTIVWNGPFGKFEAAPYDRGTLALLGYIAEANKQGAITITGGGDTEKMIKVARKSGVEVRFSHISTGGGAMLELLEGRELPGIAVLNNR